ncbi:hypothetical protein BpHYR1_000337 [Brachionus plicatilis]|uniref:BZIP domain-containing protein n=1 Tax=Brachionus plicatilis TaxID=10195 RepID=A0A3M7SC62_BRAPC|nr:hypothetical protein BpHYR1_000337 [Brachionus plicatilis]
MVSYVVTSQPAINRVAQSLKIPTVRPSKVIKIKPDQLKFLLSNQNSMVEVKQEPDYQSETKNDPSQPLLTDIKQEAADFDFDLNLEDVDLTKPLNNGESFDLDLFHTVPSAEKTPEGILTTNQIFESLGYSEKDFENLIIEYSPQTKPEQKPVQDLQKEIRNLLPSAEKRRRKKNVYRAEDISNEEDLINYLERRKKNNISSKCSRANKKRYYNELDSKCDQLEEENEFLRKKQTKLERLNVLLKDYLVENFSKTK